MDTRIAEDLYHRSLDINQQAFDAGIYNAAYHALMSAMHCAEKIDSDQPLNEVSQIAQKQLAWIDQHHPEYEHSTRSAANRHQPASIFSLLARQTEATLKMRANKRLIDKHTIAE